MISHEGMESNFLPFWCIYCYHRPVTIKKFLQFCNDGTVCNYVGASTLEHGNDYTLLWQLEYPESLVPESNDVTGEKLDKGESNFLRWFYMLKEGMRLISSTDWLIDEQSDKITFYKEWRQFKEWDDNGHWCTKVRWRGEVDVNELENRGRSVSVCPLSAFARMMCGPRIRMGTKKKFMKKSFISWTCL